MPLNNPINESQIPPPIARDKEFQDADTAHVNATDPHTQYLLQSEGDVRYRQLAVALTDADIPSGVARKADYISADATHLAATDPHTQYLLQSEGDARYLAINAKAADSQMVDGIDSSQIVFGENWHKAVGAGVSTENAFTTSGFIDIYNGGGTFPAAGPHLHGFQTRHGNASSFWGMQAGCKHDVSNEFYFRTVTAGTWQPWRRVWNDGNFIPASHAQTFEPTIKGVGRSNSVINEIVSPNQCGLEVQAANSTSAAYVAFHRPGIWGVHFGLGLDNQLAVGGWSLGNVSYKIFHEGIPLAAKAALPTALVGQNSFALSWNSVTVGQGIAELCNFAGTGGGDAFNFFRVFGNGNSMPTVANRVSRIDSTGAYLSTSDKRLKGNFSSAPGLDVILKLLPQKYDHWDCMGIDKGGEFKLSKKCKKKIGFIAQELREILPEAVAETSSPEELYTVDMNIVLACAVKAIQQLHQKVENLENRLSNHS